jgi:hypothetical protein
VCSLGTRPEMKTPLNVPRHGIVWMLVGLGMATATYPVHSSSASALVRILADGTALAQSGSQDLGIRLALGGCPSEQTGTVVRAIGTS